MAQHTLIACLKMLAMVALASAANGTGVVLPNAGSQYSQKITGDNEGYPDEGDYLIYRVGVAAGAGIIIAIISCICGVCFCFVQTCSKVCSCCERNCSCCGAGEPAPLGYTRKQRLCLVLILTIGFSMIVIGAGIAYKGNDDVKVGIDHLSTTSDTLADEIYSQVLMGYQAGNAVGADLSYTMVTDAEKLRDDVKSGIKTIQDNDNMRVYAVYGFYAVMMAVPLLGYLAWICSSGKWAFIMTQLTFCMLFFAWIFFGLTLATGTILDDTCVEAGKHVYGEPNALSELLKCNDGAAGQANYDKVWTTLDTNQNSYATTLSYTPTVQETSYNFTTNTYSTAAGITMAKRYINNRQLLLGMYTTFGVRSPTCAMMTDVTTTNLCFVPGITNSSYPGKCLSTGTEPTSKRCLQQGQILSAAGMVGSSYLIGCEHLNFIALDLNNKICGPMVDGLVNVTIGQALIGGFYFLVLIAGCMGINRFNSENDSENKIATEMAVVPNPTLEPDHSAKVHPEGPSSSEKLEIHSK